MSVRYCIKLSIQNSELLVESKAIGGISFQAQLLYLFICLYIYVNLLKCSSTGFVMIEN